MGSDVGDTDPRSVAPACGADSSPSDTGRMHFDSCGAGCSALDSGLKKTRRLVPCCRHRSKPGAPGRQAGSRALLPTRGDREGLTPDREVSEETNTFLQDALKCHSRTLSVF